MKRAHSLIIVGLLLVIAGLSLVGASPGAAQGATPAATQAATKAATPQPITDPHGTPPTFLAAYYNAWVKSPHANRDSEPFKHWDAEGQVPEGCATCHSTVGYLDFLGADRSAAGKVDKPAPVGGVITCDGCHSPTAANLKVVAFPSGAKVGDIGDSTRCIVCHQGRSSTVQVNAAVEKAKLTNDPNKVDESLNFINIHYYAAAASLYGNEVQGGYQFAGKVYQGRNRHVPGYDTCAGCHDPHTLKVKVDDCATCHEEVDDEKDLRKIRMMGSLTDFNGNGDIEEGIAAEIDGLRTILLKTMQAYATKVSGKGIAYDTAAYPYFFIDTNGNGTADKDEAVAQNAFKLFTPVLLEAAYNYQVSVKDPGGFAHNPKYHIQLLFDSIEALNAGLGGPGDTAKIQRNPPGHFDASGEPFRHWDKEGEVPGSCAKCHSAEGLPTFLKNNTAIAVKPSNSLACSTCHSDLTKFTVRPSEKVTFPSGAVVSFGRRDVDNICLNCHQGRESTVSVNNAIKASGAKADDVSDKLNFRNVHYFAAGASLFGTEAKGAYEFEGKQYNGRNLHESPFQTCNDCHNVHTLKINFSECGSCHKNVKDPRDIRAKEDDVDYNGNGQVDEPIVAEIASFQDALLQQLSAYAKKNGGVGIVYDPVSYPYFFADTNDNGKADKDEAVADNAYKKWTPNLLRGAYNYQYAQKDPGVFAHNPKYIMQVLYDSIEAVGGKDAVAKLTRPEVKASSN